VRAAIPARLNFVTLLCHDMELMTRFYRQFGWPEAPSSEAAHVIFQCSNGVVMALYAAESYERTLGAMADGFRGFSLCINCRDWGEVEAVHDAVAGYEGVVDLDELQHTSWGGGFGFRDPEGNVWEVAWADGSRVDERGGLTFH